MSERVEYKNASDKLFKHTLLNKEQEYNLILRHQKGDATATDELVTKNMRLVNKIILKIRSKFEYLGLGPDHYYASGVIGLLIAIDRFDCSLGYRLSTYASPWIRQSIGREIDNTARLIRIPTHRELDLMKVKKVYNYLQSIGVPITNDLVCSELVRGFDDMTPELATTLLELHHESMAMEFLDSHSPSEEGGEPCPEFMYNKVSGTDETVLEDNIVADSLSKLLGIANSILTDREMIVLNNRYGIESDYMTLEEVGLILGVTRERVRQIQKSALDKLEKFMVKNDHKLESFL